jgi:hypothetical protein
MDENRQLVVEIPKRLQVQKNRPCTQAYVFRIEPRQ